MCKYDVGCARSLLEIMMLILELHCDRAPVCASLRCAPQERRRLVASIADMQSELASVHNQIDAIEHLPTSSAAQSESSPDGSGDAPVTDLTLEGAVSAAPCSEAAMCARQSAHSCVLHASVLPA
jgi:hypothetical protein